MAIHASPGVYYEVQDFSTYAPQLTVTTLGLVGKAKKGPSEPTFISSVRQFTDTYGLPGKTDYSALAAISYLEYGNALWYRRLVGPGAVKASADIPTANEHTKEIIKIEKNTVDHINHQYIFTGNISDDGNAAAIPGTLSIEIAIPEYDESGKLVGKKNPFYIVDDKEGSFDTTKYSVLSNIDNYIDYISGRYQFSLNAGSTSSSSMVIKYGKKIYSPKNNGKVKIDNTGSKSASKSFNLTELSPYALAVVDLDNFELDVVVKESTTTGDMIDKAYTLVLKWDNVNGICNVVNKEDETQIKGTFDLAGTVTLNDLPVSAIYNGTFITYGDYGFDTNDNNAYTGSVGYPLIANKVYVFDGNAWKIEGNDSVVNIFKAIVRDDGTNNFTDDITNYIKTEKLDTAKDTPVNVIDYDSGNYRLVLADVLDNRLITTTYMAKFSKTFIFAEGSHSIVDEPIKASVVANSVKVLRPDGTIYASDNGDGDLVDNEGNIVGSIDYAHKAIDGSIEAIISIVYNNLLGDPTDRLIVTYIKSMGKIEARSYGESENGVLVQFFKEDPNFIGSEYYGLNIWNAESYVTQAPTEVFRKFTFGDNEATTYFLSKVTSTLVTFTLYDTTGSQKPLMNYVVGLTGGKEDLEHVTENTAVSALDDLGDVESYDLNLVAIPDYPGNKIVAEKLIDFCENMRGDCFAIIDPPQGLSVQNKVAWHNGTGIYANENALSSPQGQAAIWSSWIRINNQFTESIQWVPPSVKIVAVIAYSDAHGEIWFAPAGLNRGILFNVIGCEDSLTLADRDLLYATDNNAINPIAKFSGDGIAVFGQKTLHRGPSALDRINVVRLILYVTKVLATAVKYLLFEPDDLITWTQYVDLVTPFLENIKSRRGLYAYKVTCDETTNTAYDIDNNTMVAEIMLQPTKAAERIITRFKITSSGASLM